MHLLPTHPSGWRGGAVDDTHVLPSSAVLHQARRHAGLLTFFRLTLQRPKRVPRTDSKERKRARWQGYVPGYHVSRLPICLSAATARDRARLARQARTLHQTRRKRGVTTKSQFFQPARSAHDASCPSIALMLRAITVRAVELASFPLPISASVWLAMLQTALHGARPGGSRPTAPYSSSRLWPPGRGAPWQHGETFFDHFSGVQALHGPAKYGPPGPMLNRA